MEKLTIQYSDIAVGADADANVSAPMSESFCNINTVPFGGTEKVVSTLETNLWVLDSSCDIHGSETPSFLSNVLSGDDCSFTTPPVMTINFTQQYTSLGVSIQFTQFEPNYYCSLVNVKWYQNDTLLSSKDFTISSNNAYCANTVKAYNKIIITFLKTNLPHRRVRVNRILFGVMREFNKPEIREAKIDTGTDIISNNIEIGTMNWTLDSLEDVEYIFQGKQPVTAYTNDTLIGIFYIKQADRKAENLFEIQTEDALGVLDQSNFTATKYDGANAKTVLSGIIGDSFKLNLDSSYNNATLTGYIKDCTKREAIHQIAFALSASVSTMGSDGIDIFPAHTENPTVLDIEEVFQSSSVKMGDTITAVNLTSHDLVADSNGDVEIDGIKYKDNTIIHTKTNPNRISSDKDNVVNIEEMTLISPNNVDTVLDNVYNYIIRRNTMSTKIIVGEHKAGDFITVPKSWGEAVTGNVTKMSISLSNLTVADIEVVGE